MAVTEPAPTEDVLTEPAVAESPMTEPPVTSPPGLTPSQTVGPFLHLVLAEPDDVNVVPPGTPGAIRVGGTVVDGDGQVVADALVETWQADEAGRFDHPENPRGPARSAVPGFRGFGRCPTGPDGAWAVHTIKPGPVREPDGTISAPHLAVSVFARGLLDRLVTRCYFADEVEANAADPVVAGLPDDDRAALLAIPGPDGYRFDIRLQGARETVFFRV
jgi:protocatechuate 3,4-dioxygenase alpha subunit